MTPRRARPLAPLATEVTLVKWIPAEGCVLETERLALAVDDANPFLVDPRPRQARPLPCV